MTFTQTQAVWELCRQGLPLLADEAAEHWERGLQFRLRSQVRIARAVEALIDQCNWEVGRREETV